MAIAIKSIPILKNKEADSFQKAISKNSANSGSIDFKDQYRNSIKILNKAKA